MARQLSKKRKIEEGTKGRVSKRPDKKLKKQVDYESASSDDEQENFNAVDLRHSDEDDGEGKAPIGAANSEFEVGKAGSDSEISIISDSESNSVYSDIQRNTGSARKQKRNDPEAFATSISKILGSKLSTRKRNDPVLSRSINALQASKEITDQALEKKARLKLREERKAVLDKGRVKGIFGVSIALDATHRDGEMNQRVAESTQVEKRLRKTAHRGVVKLFNAVQAAQVKGNEAAREAKIKSLVGYGKREEKSSEMSKKGFLKLISGSEGLGNDTAQEA